MYMDKVLGLIREKSLEFDLGRTIEEVVEGALAADGEDEDEHLARAEYFLNFAIGNGHEAEGDKEEEAEDDAGEDDDPGAGESDAAAGEPLSGRRTCIGCGLTKGGQGFPSGSAKCRECHRVEG